MSTPAPSSSSAPTECKWRFCTEIFADRAELESHLASHVQEATPVHHPKEERDSHLHHVPVLAGATADGERPHPHAEQSFPAIDRKTGEIEPALNHEQ